MRKMWEELERKGFDVDAKDGCCAIKGVVELPGGDTWLGGVFDLPDSAHDQLDHRRPLALGQAREQRAARQRVSQVERL